MANSVILCWEVAIKYQNKLLLYLAFDNVKLKNSVKN